MALPPVRKVEAGADREPLRDPFADPAKRTQRVPGCALGYSTRGEKLPAIGARGAGDRDLREGQHERSQLRFKTSLSGDVIVIPIMCWAR